DPSARALGGGSRGYSTSEPMFSLARAAITGEVPLLIAPGLIPEPAKKELHSVTTPRRTEASSSSLRPTPSSPGLSSQAKSQPEVRVAVPAASAAASSSGERAAYRARREISIPELHASDIMLDEEQPLKLERENM